MARYIDEERMMAVLKIDITNVKEQIDKIIVRCKDCYFYKNNHICIHFSKYGTIETKPNDFCSFGERRTDGEI